MKKEISSVSPVSRGCEVTNCPRPIYENALCRPHYRLSLDPAVRLALEDYKRRQELDRLTSKKNAKAG